LLFIGINFLEFRICTLAYSSKLIVLNQSICVLVVIVDGIIICLLSSYINSLDFYFLRGETYTAIAIPLSVELQGDGKMYKSPQ